MQGYLAKQFLNLGTQRARGPSLETLLAKHGSSDAERIAPREIQVLLFGA
jgi:hypothetical protein